MKIFNLPKLIIFRFKARFPLDSKWEYLTIFFGRQFPGFKYERFRRHISSNIVKYRQILSNIVRLKYQTFLIIIAKYHRSLWLILKNFRCYQKMPLVKQGLSWAKQVLREPPVLKRNKLKIKIDENKISINKSYLYLFIPHLNWLCFADLPASCVLRTLQQISLKTSKMLEFGKTLIRSIKP